MRSLTTKQIRLMLEDAYRWMDQLRAEANRRGANQASVVPINEVMEFLRKSLDTDEVK